MWAAGGTSSGAARSRRASRAHPEAVLAAADGDDARADGLAHEALTLAAAEGMISAVIAAIETLAAVHPAGGADRALRLAAAAAHLRDEIGYRLELPAIRRRLDQLLVHARASLGDDFQTAWTEGTRRHMARGSLLRPTHAWRTTTPDPRLGQRLTPTEHDVVALIAEGLTNPQIAARMLIETSTVKSHVHHIFTKLGITTRSQLAATASRRT